MRTLLAIIACLLLGTCSQPPSTLDQILTAGELRVVTLNNPSTYYLGADGPQGPEFDLASAFAADLGVALHIYSVPNISQLFDEVATGRAQIAAASLATEQAAPGNTRYGPVYQRVKEHLVYRKGNDRPHDLLDASHRGQIEVASNSPHDATLQRLRNMQPELSWMRNPNAETDDLFYRITQRELEYTVADSNEFAIGRSFHPDLGIAFDLGSDKSIAWLVHARDFTLLNRVSSFFTVLYADNRLKDILNRYYYKRRAAPVLHARSFIEDIREKLPLYVDWFKEAAATQGIDWRLLAAIGYQESKWTPDATSPTGVRGMMMLTESTARSLNVMDRLDPRESIVGGARYFTQTRDMIPARIKEPDKTWFTLAAYNMGFGHIEDARIFAQADGKNPDKWDVVREYLPLLTQEKWYLQAKRGYARGWEPVQFVDSVKLYMSMMDWAGAQGGLADTMDKARAEAASAESATP